MLLIDKLNSELLVVRQKQQAATQVELKYAASLRDVMSELTKASKAKGADLDEVFSDYNVAVFVNKEIKKLNDGVEAYEGIMQTTTDPSAHYKLRQEQSDLQTVVDALTSYGLPSLTDEQVEQVIKAIVVRNEFTMQTPIGQLLKTVKEEAEFYCKANFVLYEPGRFVQTIREWFAGNKK